MANIKKLKANGQDIVPITHEQAVLDSNGVTLDSKLNAINNAISRLENNSTSGTPSNPSLGGNTTIITMGNYTIKYNETDDTLDFIYNGVIDEPVVPNNYVSEGLSLYIDANDVTSYGSIRDITGKQTITNHGVSTTLDNGCLNFVSTESDYIDCGFKPNLTKWSVEACFYFTATPTSAETLLGWGASGNRTAIAVWGNGFMIAINGNVEHTIMATAPTSLTHLVLTYNNGTIIAYVNGIKTELATNANVMSSQASNLMIGTKYNASGEFGDIHLKSLRFYDGKVLTDKEALQNYNYEINRNDEVVSVTWIDNRNINIQGVENDDTSAMVTDYLTKEDGYNYTINLTDVSSVKLYFYNSTKTFISRTDNLTVNSTDTLIEFPTGCKYFRIKSDKGTATVSNANTYIVLKKIAIPSDPNIIKPTWKTNTKLDTNTGLEAAADKNACSNFISYDNSYNYTLAIDTVTFFRVYYYDSSQSYISNDSIANNFNGMINPPENTAYIRLKLNRGTAEFADLNNHVIFRKTHK